MIQLNQAHVCEVNSLCLRRTGSRVSVRSRTHRTMRKWIDAARKFYQVNV